MIDICPPLRRLLPTLHLAGLLLGGAAVAVPSDPEQSTPAETPRSSSTPGPKPEPSAGPYLRLGAGIDWPDGTGFDDDNCASRQPAALFGCGAGNNGQALGAKGDLEQALVMDGALGYRFNRWLRAEALLSWRPDLDFNGQSNFLGVAGLNQPVTGTVSSVAGFGVAYVDLPRLGQVRPFLGAGLGLARNRINALQFNFPGIAAEATTTTPGGSSSQLAYLLTAGLSIPLSPRVDLDLAYRFSDLGTIQTGPGEALVVRPAGTFRIPIDGTHADLQTHGLLLSVRYLF